MSLNDACQLRAKTRTSCQRAPGNKEPDAGNVRTAGNYCVGQVPRSKVVNYKVYAAL